MKNNNHKFTIFSFCLFAALIISSCTKTWITDEMTSNHTEVFPEMWNDINENYVFFDQKEVDWEEVRQTTEAQLNENLSQEEVFEVYANMLSQLKDGHVSLYSNFNEWKYYDLFLSYPTNYNEEVIQKHYLTQINAIGPFIYDIIDNNTGYLRYASFGDDISNEDLGYLQDYFKNTDGLIIDIRGNRGGASDNVAQLLKLSLSEDMPLGKIYNRVDGELRADSHILHAATDFEQYSNQIVVLTNRECYSSCNIYAAYASQLDGITLMGDTTGGGSGLALARELGNAWQYRFSAGKITLEDGTELENGFEPDIKVSTDESDAAENKDAILDMALEILR